LLQSNVTHPTGRPTSVSSRNVPSKQARYCLLAALLASRSLLGVSRGGRLSASHHQVIMADGEHRHGGLPKLKTTECLGGAGAPLSGSVAVGHVTDGPIEHFGTHPLSPPVAAGFVASAPSASSKERELDGVPCSVVADRAPRGGSRRWRQRNHFPRRSQGKHPLGVHCPHKASYHSLLPLIVGSSCSSLRVLTMAP
jgi:hypothetical protein